MLRLGSSNSQLAGAVQQPRFAAAGLATRRSRKLGGHVNSSSPIRLLQRSIACLGHEGDGCARTERRRVMAALVLLAVGSGSQQRPAEASEELLLPKAYLTVAQNIVKSLREALAAEVDGSKEYEIRRKADPAKENVREFVGKWRDDSRVSWHPSHQEIQAAIMELGQFYQRAGPRARLSTEVQQSVRKHLDAAEQSLTPGVGSRQQPPAEPSLLGLFSGA